MTTKKTDTNAFLANTVGKINALAAWVIFLGSAAGGLVTGELLGLIVGLIGGAIAAILVCGLTAVFIDMRSSLREMLAALQDDRAEA